MSAHDVANGRVKWYHHVTDFANILKAFIGTNYLSLAYGFKMSGLALGIVMGVVVCCVTNHCCQLLVHCKTHLVDDLCYKFMYRQHRRSNNIRDCDVDSYKDNLMKNMTYADIGSLALGKWCALMIKIFLCITQIGFCIQYCIFLGNMCNTFIVANMQKQKQDTNISNENPIIDENQSALFNYGENLEVFSMPSEGSQDIVPLAVLVMLPIVLFIPLTMFRNVRQMGIISILANLCVFIGFCSVFFYIILEFKVNPTFEWTNWITLPIYIGSVTAAYEAIGTIIPIESSMDNNRHNFGRCLLGAIGLFTALVGTLATIGYLQYGEDVEQILAQNLPADEPVVMVINITLMIGVVFTYPLQIYPVIEIIEALIFGQENSSTAASYTVRYSHSRASSEGEKPDIIYLSGGDTSSGGEKSPLLTASFTSTSSTSGQGELYGENVALIISKSVPTWKRNIVRTVVPLFIVLMAAALRNVFAYVGAFVGALGSTPLAFVLPCMLHLHIQRQHISTFSKIKDVSIMIFGIVCGVLGVAVSIKEIIRLA